MKFRVIVYQGFGESYEKKFKTLSSAKKFQENIWKKGGPKHFVTVQEKKLVWCAV
jgi:hypothetical protein